MILEWEYRPVALPEIWNKAATCKDHYCPHDRNIEEIRVRKLMIGGKEMGGKNRGKNKVKMERVDRSEDWETRIAEIVTDKGCYSKEC